MATCDLCGEYCKASDMTTLRSEYQITSVADVCIDCCKWANDLKSSLLCAIPKQIQDAISIKKGIKPNPPKKSFFRRIFRQAARL